MKYIVLSQEIGANLIREVPIIFPNYLIHAEVAEAIIKGCSGFSGAKAVSAGECSSTDLNPKCHGKSTTLNVESRGEEDSQLFPMYDYFHGIKDA